MPGNAIELKELREQMKLMRPPDLKVLLEKEGLGGNYVLGMYGVEIDQFDSDLRSFKLWRETPADLRIYSETARCSKQEPLRVKRSKSSIYVRRLNPGGEITSMNLEDHLVWWAACVPEIAGTHPSTLRNKAIALGYSTGLVESQEILPGHN